MGESKKQFTCDMCLEYKRKVEQDYDERGVVFKDASSLSRHRKTKNHKKILQLNEKAYEQALINSFCPNNTSLQEQINYVSADNTNEMIIVHQETQTVNLSEISILSEEITNMIEKHKQDIETKNQEITNMIAKHKEDIEVKNQEITNMIAKHIRNMIAKN